MAKFWQGLILLLIALAVSFSLIEIFLRVTNYSDLATFTAPCIRGSSIPGLNSELIPNCTEKGYMPWNSGVLIHINSCGFRGSEEECSLLKADDTTGSSSPYIYMAGDSYANAGNLNEEDSFAKVAEAKLREKINKATVFNVGITAADVDQKMLVIRYFLDKYPAKPAVVVYQWLLNDYDPMLDFSKAKSPKTKLKIFLRKYFYTYRFIVNIKYRLVRAVIKSPVTTTDVREYRKKEFSNEEAFTKLQGKLCSFAEYLKEKNIKPVFLNPVMQEMLSDWKDYDETMENIDKRINSVAEGCGWTVVWSTEESKKYPINDIVLVPNGDHHPNILGNKIIGEALGEKLKIILAE